MIVFISACLLFPNSDENNNNNNKRTPLSDKGVTIQNAAHPWTGREVHQKGHGC